jgi:D-glycero-alpha-D-manno-heptose 1-phosphate guanylyltransferase
MIQEAIILAGGLGTRLRDAVPDLPKCMAPVNGRPFIAYVVDYLQQQGITDIIFALGYKNEAFESFLSSLNINYQLSIEDEPLGTGGAIRLACNKIIGEDAIITNGDTLFEVNIAELSQFHLDNNADCTLSLKPMKDFNRYGVVELNDDNIVSSFKEKQYYKSGLINGGVYAINAKQLLQEGLPEKFSFEKDYLEKYYDNRKMLGFVQDGYFIDIGIPGDYQRAGREFNAKRNARQ